MPAMHRKPTHRRGGSQSLRNDSQTAKSSKKKRPRQSPSGFSVAKLRAQFGVDQEVFGRLSGYSRRAVAGWEAGRPVSGPSLQRLAGLKRLQSALAKVMKTTFVGDWLRTPNSAFDGLKPVEVIERGEVDRIWRMIYELESGQPG